MEYDASVLARLTGRSGGLRPAGSTTSSRIIRGTDSTTTLQVRVTGHGKGTLLLESTDPRMVGLDRRAVVVDFGSGSDFLRLHGSIEILPSTDRILVALHPVAVPRGLQRRQAVRVRTEKTVQLARYEGGSEGRTWHTTTTVDFSAGGARLATIGDFQVGQRLVIAMELASGPIELMGQVLAIMDDGTTRIRFIDVPNPDGMRLLQDVRTYQTLSWFPRQSSDSPRFSGSGPIQA